jgi:hypothetical protein
MEKKLPDLIITELFLVKAGSDWTRTFMGKIKRETDGDGIPVVRGEVVVQEGKIWSMAGTEEELGKNLDDFCRMKLDLGLHDFNDVSVKISNISFNLN